MEELKQKAKEFTDYLYKAYGSGTGVLFGILSNCRDAVYAIVKLVMEKEEKEINKLKLELENKDFQYAREYNSNWDKREQLQELRNKTFDEILTIISEVKSMNPYPSDIFRETPQRDKQKINKFCRDNGISIDEYNGSWGNKVWNNCCDDLVRIIKETKDDEGLKITQPLGEVASVVVK